MAVSDSHSAASEDGVEPEVGLTIEQVSGLVELPIPTIRSWERRHKVPVVSRTPGGHRRYTPGQLDTLRRMRDLVAQGLRPVDAAARVKAEDATSAEALVEDLLRAAQEFQPDAIGDVLDAARRALGLGRTVDEVLLPGIRELGDWWQSGDADVSHEHLASHAIRGWLSQVNAAVAPPMRSTPIILSCGPRDDHTIALEALGALLRERGGDCRMLGARTPSESLARAVRDTAAAAVVVVCQLAPGRQAAVDSLRLVEQSQTTIYYAGAAFASPQARQGVPGKHLGDNLTQAADAIIDTLSARQPHAGAGSSDKS